MTRKIVAYKIVNLALFDIDDITLECELDEDWQPYGSPVYVPGGDPIYLEGRQYPKSRPDRFVQAMVVYEDEADQ
jgi:hypothetical protein